MFLTVASKSLLNRKGSVAMTLMAISVAIFVLLGIEHVRQQARDSFASTVSGVDLIVGAKTGSLNLLLYSVFRIGSPTDNIRWETYEQVVADPAVAWAIPISLGDSHEGYRVVGTTSAYFDHFSYGKKRRIEFTNGAPFEGTFDAVLGSEVAKTLGYKVDSEIILAHGLATTSFSLHDNKPFTVVGILAPTGTPVDQTIHVLLQGIDAMHSDWPQGPSNLAVKSGAESGANSAKPASITAFMLGLKSKMSIFGVQRQINDLKAEPLMAILPGVALAELWQMVGLFEDVLRLISALVLLAAVLGLGAVLLSSVRERNQEIHLLRILGAPPYYLFFLIEMEAVLIALAGMLIGGACLYVALILVEDALFANFGLYLEADLLTLEGLSILGAVLLSAIVAAAVPSVQIYTAASRYFER